MGSEMCIRDRCTPPRGRPRRTAAGRPPPGRGGRRRYAVRSKTHHRRTLPTDLAISRLRTACSRAHVADGDAGGQARHRVLPRPGARRRADGARRTAPCRRIHARSTHPARDTCSARSRQLLGYGPPALRGASPTQLPTDRSLQCLAFGTPALSLPSHRRSLRPRRTWCSSYTMYVAPSHHSTCLLYTSPSPRDS